MMEELGEVLVTSKPRGLIRCDGGHTGFMLVVLVVLGVVAMWCFLMLPLAVAIGRAFHAGSEDVAFEEIVRRHDSLRV